MLSTSALTWAAAQAHIQIWELTGMLTPADEARIEAAYREWRRRAAAGERRHKVDWRSFPVPEAVEAAAPEATAPASPSIPKEDGAAPWDSPDDAAIAEVVENILSEAPAEPDYISLDDFNLEPSEEEMKVMAQTLREEEAMEEEASVEAIPDVGMPVERRISKLAREADPEVYGRILADLGNDVETARAVVEAVMRDHTRRHRGTAAQRAFLDWLNER